MLVYPSSIDLSSHALRYLAGQLTSRGQEIGTRWRRLTPGRQARVQSRMTNAFIRIVFIASARDVARAAVR